MPEKGKESRVLLPPRWLQQLRVLRCWIYVVTVLGMTVAVVAMACIGLKNFTSKQPDSWQELQPWLLTLMISAALLLLVGLPHAGAGLWFWARRRLRRSAPGHD